MSARALKPGPRLIRGPALRRALIGGARSVMAHRETLNRINVFPVADGDTGNNLAFTLGSIIHGALSRPVAGVGELLHRVSEHAVDGGRGNSGAILAQFLTGVAAGIGDRIAVAPAQLANAVRTGAQAARSAVAEPKEGTMLSVISAFAEALETRTGIHDIHGWFDAALRHARKALAHTPRQLPVLLRAGVVDAGAQGFLDLLEGIGAYLAGTAPGPAAPARMEPADPREPQPHLEAGDADPAHRWCTECLVTGRPIEQAALRRAVSALDASCVVVAGGPTRMRVHAHVDRPQALFDSVARFGRVDACKADDMHAQARTVASRQAVAVVTDSSADLPEGVAERLNLHVVPLRLSFGDRDYLDKVGLSPARFYRMLRERPERPRTSQPAPGDFRRLFDFLLAHHRAVVYVGVARAVSGTIQSAETAAQRGEAGRARIVDSANAAAGQALLAMAAAAWAQEGVDADTIVDRLQALRSRTLTWAMTRDLGMAVRGGRLPAWTKPVVEALGLTPVARVKPSGKLGVVSGLFGTHRLPQRFAAHVARRVDRGRRWRLIVGHGDAAADGEVLLACLRERLDCPDAWLVETGPAIGAHAGPGTLVVSLQPLEG